MKVSTKWLNELIDIKNISIDELYNKISNHSIEIDDSAPLLNATNITIGKVLSKEKHPDADKLNICSVDIGSELLQIVCGAKNVDKNQFVIVAKVGAILPGNFKIKKSKIRGVESFGMICSLSELGIDKSNLSNEELEGIKVLGNDALVGTSPSEYLGLDTHVFELGLTPNRSDLLSMYGVARDVKAIFDLDFKIDDIDIKYSKDNKLEIIENNDLAETFFAVKLDNIEVKESSNYIKSILLANDIKPINNIVDITNYIMILTGQPMHAYDTSIGEKIEIKSNLKDDIVTLDDVTRKTNSEDILIVMDNKIVGLAGVMGSLASSITNDTKSIILEAAIFNSNKVRKTSKRLNLRTDASVRFERGVSPLFTKHAIEHAIKLICEDSKATIASELSGYDNIDKEDLKIEVNVSYINKFLGIDLDFNKYKSILESLDFKVFEEYVLIPKFRLDIEAKQDIAEEIIRILGFEALNNNLPNTSSDKGYSLEQNRIKKVKNIMKSFGLNQVITYSLTSEKKALMYSKELKKSLLMPISDERKYLRSSIVPSHLEVINYNNSRQMKNINIFEVGTLFNDVEETFLTISMSGKYNETTWNNISGSYSKVQHYVDFYVIKGLVESLFKEFNIKAVYKECKINDMHPYQCAKIIVGNEEVGFIGNVHPNVVKSNKIENTFTCELSLDKVFKFIKDDIMFEEVPMFPTMVRDLSVEINRDVKNEEILNSCIKSGKKMLKEIKTINYYIGENIDVDKKSIAFKLVFEDKAKTLTFEEVDQRFNKIVKDLEKNFNAKLRK